MPSFAGVVKRLTVMAVTIFIIDLSVIHDRCHTTTVIPAKAGIQIIKILSRSETTPQIRLCPLRGDCLINWIPAFAGMTIRGLHTVAFVSSVVSNYGKLNSWCGVTAMTVPSLLPLMKQLAIRLAYQKTIAKSMVIPQRGE